MTSRKKAARRATASVSASKIKRTLKRASKSKVTSRAAPKRKPRELGKRLSSDERRRQIIEAVEELFKTRPYADIGVPDVAEVVGITQGLVYHYFPTKEALLVAAVELRASELLRFCLSDVTQPFMTQLERAVKGYIDYVEAHSVAYINLFTGPGAAEPEILRICEQTRQAMINHFLTALHLERAHLPATRLSLRGYFGYAECVILNWLKPRNVERPVLERMCYAAILSALKAGLASEVQTPLSPQQLAQLEASFKQHFELD